MKNTIYHKWSPIEDLPSNWHEYAMPGLAALLRVWQDQKENLEKTSAYQTFLERMRREIAIETGLIERLYTLDRGITQTLIKNGIKESLIPNDASDHPIPEVIALIQDQEEAVEGLFDFVARRTPLTKHYIRSLHQVLTKHQSKAKSIDSQGAYVEVPLIRGDWKRLPNNPTRPDGSIHEYCPPEHVESEMDSLIKMHHQHLEKGVLPEIEAAWLHHRFTQIHPFQDGNGRVVRCLASIVLIQAEYFPLVVRDENRGSYIDFLEQADKGDLRPLITFFSQLEEKELLSAVKLSEETLLDKRHVPEIIESVRNRLKNKQPELASRFEKTKKFLEEIYKCIFSELEKTKHELHSAFGEFLPNFNASVARGADEYVNDLYLKPIYFGIHSTGYDVTIFFKFIFPAGKELGILQIEVTAEGAGPTPERVSRTPFQFSYEDEIEELLVRFKIWLDDVLAASLVYWQRNI